MTRDPAGVVPSGGGSSGRKRTNADEHLAASFLETEEDSDEAVYLCELNLQMHDEATRTKLHRAVSQIDCTDPEWKEWVDDVFAGKVENFECFNEEARRWEPMPWHPKLRLRVKEGARPPKTHKYKTPIHLRDMLQKFHET